MTTGRMTTVEQAQPRTMQEAVTSERDVDLVPIGSLPRSASSRGECTPGSCGRSASASRWCRFAKRLSTRRSPDRTRCWSCRWPRASTTTASGPVSASRSASSTSTSTHSTSPAPTARASFGKWERRSSAGRSATRSSCTATKRAANARRATATTRWDATARRSGATRRRTGASRSSRWRSRSSSCQRAPDMTLGEVGELRARSLHRVPHARRPREPQAGRDRARLGRSGGARHLRLSDLENARRDPDRRRIEPGEGGAGAAVRSCGDVEPERFPRPRMRPERDAGAKEDAPRGDQGFRQGLHEGRGDTTRARRRASSTPGERRSRRASSWRAPMGRIVICAATSGFDLTFDVRHLWMRQKQILGSHFAHAEECWRANELVLKGTIKPSMTEVYAYPDIPRAHDDMLHNRHMGKLSCLVSSPRAGYRTLSESLTAGPRLMTSGTSTACRPPSAAASTTCRTHDQPLARRGILDAESRISSPRVSRADGPPHLPGDRLEVRRERGDPERGQPRHARPRGLHPPGQRGKLAAGARQRHSRVQQPRLGTAPALLPPARPRARSPRTRTSRSSSPLPGATSTASSSRRPRARTRFVASTRRSRRSSASTACPRAGSASRCSSRA